MSFLKEKTNINNQSDFKNKIGIREKFVITFLGRLSKRKNPVEMVNIFKAIKKEVDSVALMYIGAGSEREKLVKNIARIILIMYFY